MDTRIEGVQKKSRQVLHHIVKTIDPLVKIQTKGQNNGSRALICGIAHLFSSITFRDTTSLIEI